MWQAKNTQKNYAQIFICTPWPIIFILPISLYRFKDAVCKTRFTYLTNNITMEIYCQEKIIHFKKIRAERLALILKIFDSFHNYLLISLKYEIIGFILFPFLMRKR